jgi:hypothetical protein
VLEHAVLVDGFAQKKPAGQEARAVDPAAQ